jgi:hypothetical protein
MLLPNVFQRCVTTVVHKPKQLAIAIKDEGDQLKVRLGAPAGIMRWSPSIVIRGLQIGTVPQQVLHDFDRSAPASDVQYALGVLVAGIHALA